MSTGQEGAVSLSHRLARRLRPMVAAVCLLILAGPASLYLYLEGQALRTAAGQAGEEVADRLRGFIISNPRLWTYQVPKYFEFLRYHVQTREIVAIQVLDAAGQPLSQYQYQSPQGGSWEGRVAVEAVRPLVFNDQTFGTIRVAVSARNLLLKLALTLALSLGVAVSLVLAAYLYPVRVARRLEDRAGRLLAELERANDHLEEEVRARTADLSRSKSKLEAEVRQRRETEAALAESEAQYRALVENSLEGIVVLQDGRLVFVNSRLVEGSGYSVKEILSRNFTDFIHPEDQPYVFEFLARRQDGDAAPYFYSFRMMHRTGATRWVEIKSLIIDWAGRPASLIFLSDITSRRQTQEALKESETRFRQIAENIRELFWLFDPRERRILYLSPAFEDIWGRPRAAVLADPEVWEEALHPDDRAWVGQAHQEMAATLSGYDLEYRIVRPDGSLRWVHDRAFPVRDESGRLVRLAGLAEDVTLAKETEAALRRAKEAAEGSDRAKSIFLAQASQALRTPVSGILGLTRLLLEENLTATQRGDLAAIQDSGRRLRAMVDDLLLLAQLEAGRVAPRSQPFNLARLLAQQAEEFRPVAAAKGLTLTLDQATGPLWVGDPDLLTEVLRRLLDNALKFTLAGRVELRAAHDQGGSADRLRLTVQDTGPGLDPETPARLRRPFTPAEAGPDRPFGGLGLGLAVANQVINLLGGRLTVENPVGGGAAVHLELPWAKADAVG